MKNLKQIIILIFTLLTLSPTFSQTADDWRQVLKRAEKIIKAEEERIANEKAGFGRITNAERKIEEERIAAEKKEIAAEEERIAAEKNAEYVKLLDAYFMQIPNKNYKVMTTEVTQKQWQTIMGNNPSYCKGENNPVQDVSLYDCIVFCNKLSEKLGLEKCYYQRYYIKDKEVTKEKYDKANKNRAIQYAVDFEANGYRLPTVEEWEYAAKGGENYAYSGSDNLDEVGWYEKNSEKTTHPVAQKKANGYGLYDMSGNVWEWCWDSSGSYRYTRGGSYRNTADHCAVWYRYGSSIGRYYYLGFRLFRTSK